MTGLAASLPVWGRVLMYVLLGIGVAGCWVFVAMYTTAYRWWNNEFGRHLIAFSTALGLFLTYYSVRVFWTDMPGRTQIVITLFVFLDAVIVWRAVLFWRIRRAELRESGDR